MEIKTFWIIVLKGIGLWLLMNCLYIFPQITITLFTSQVMKGWNTSIPELMFGIFSLIGYLIVSCLFLFKTSFLISKLRLDRNFTENKIDITVSTNTVLKVIVILLGGTTILNSFPSLIKEIFQFIQQKELLRNYPNITWLVFHFLNTLIGYLLMTNSTLIVKCIDKQKEK